MAWRLSRRPLITVACHEDLTATDLVGRYLLHDDATVWSDGPLTRAVRDGAILYLDEIVEARKDTTVVIHALTDHRRLLTIEKTGEQLVAHADFLLVISYNPGYQSVLKDLKPSTRQRFVTLPFHYPPLDAEAQIVAHEGGVDAATARQLAELGHKVRQLDGHAASASVGTRLLVYAAQLIAHGIAPRRACEAAITRAVGGDDELRQAIADLIDVIVP
jgi:nitric oxide reductase NorQ protein